MNIHCHTEPEELVDYLREMYIQYGAKPQMIQAIDNLYDALGAKYDLEKAGEELAVLAKQRSEFMRAMSSMPAPNCASGTWENTGGNIHKAIRTQHRTSLLNCPAQIRRERTPEQWQEMYDEAMKEKRA